MICLCEKCGGIGTVCSRCRRSRSRGAKRADPCTTWTCRGGRVVPCDDHVLTHTACDVCGVIAKVGSNPFEAMPGTFHQPRLRWHHRKHPVMDKTMHLCGDCEESRLEIEAIMVWDVLMERNHNARTGKQWNVNGISGHPFAEVTITTAPPLPANVAKAQVVTLGSVQVAIERKP